MSVDRFAHIYPSMTPYQYAENNPILFIDVNGDSTKRTNIPDEFVETEPIVVTATSNEPSGWNPLTWVSWLVFDEANYYKPLFTGDGMEWIATMQASIIPAGKAGKGLKAVGKKLLTNAAKKLTKAQLLNIAKKLGFKKVATAPFNSKGQEVFKKGTRYITRDIDSHKGGFWKMFDKHGNRIGTYDKNLKTKIGK